MNELTSELQFTDIQGAAFVMMMGFMFGGMLITLGIMTGALCVVLGTMLIGA